MTEISIENRQLPQAHRDLLQLVFDKFAASGKWPNSRDLQIAFSPNDFWSVVGQINFQFLKSLGQKNIPDSKTILSIEGIALCDGSEKYIDLFIRALNECVKVYVERPAEPIILSIELKESLSLSDQEASIAMEMLGSTNQIWQSANATPEGQYTRFSLYPDVLKYKDVADFEEYIEIANQDRIQKKRESEEYFGTSNSNTSFIDTNNSKSKGDQTLSTTKFSGNPLGSFVFRLLVNDTVFTITCPRESHKKPNGETSEVFKFRFKSETEEFDVLATASDTLLACDVAENGFEWAALRGVKAILEEGKKEQFLSTGNFISFKDDIHKKLSESSFRNEIVNYLLRRYDISFEEPFSIIEILVAIESTPTRVIRALRYLHKHEMISFSWAPEVWPDIEDDNQWLIHEFAISNANLEKMKKEKIEKRPSPFIRERNHDSLKWDFFICHASEDKTEVVEPLAIALTQLGVKVWYDKWTLKMGDSLSRKIDEGLSRSKYGIVVISPSFFEKEWPQRELGGLVQKEIGGQKVILPIWHNVTEEFVRSKSPTLADKVAGTTKSGIEKLAKEIIAVDNFNHDIQLQMSEENLIDEQSAHLKSVSKEPSIVLNVASLSISFKELQLGYDVHLYSLIVSFTLLSPPDQGRLKLKLWWPSIVPITKENRLEAGDREIVEGYVVTREKVVKWEERVFPGETINLIGPTSEFRLEYKVNQQVWSEIQKGTVELKYSLHFEDHPAITGTKSFKKLNNF